MPRKSFDASNVIHLATNSRPRLTPPRFLATEHRSLFKRLADLNPHLTRTDEPLLALLSQAIHKTNKLGRGNNFKEWEIATRATLMLARALRLTSRSSTRAGRVATQQKDQHRTDLAQQMRAFRAVEDDE